MRTIVAIAAFASLFALNAASAQAQADDIWRAGARINVVASGHHDVWAAGALVTVRGTIANELKAAGAEIDINASAKGDAWIAGAIVAVEGSYERDLCAAGARVNINARVGGKLCVAGARVLIGPRTEVRGAMQLAGADVAFAGVSQGAAEIYGDTVRIDGRVVGDLLVRARNVAVGKTAVIEGNAVFETLDDPQIEQGATIRGRQTVTLPRPPKPSGWDVAGGLLALVLFSIGAGFVAGLVLLIVRRSFVERSVDALRGRPGRSALVGIAVLILVPLVAVLLMVTVVGIPAGLLTLLALPLLWLVATVLSAFALGDMLLNRSRAARSFGGSLWLLIVGLVVLTLLGLIPVVGFLVWLVALILGLGAAWRGLREQPAEAIAPAA